MIDLIKIKKTRSKAVFINRDNVMSIEPSDKEPTNCYLHMGGGHVVHFQGIEAEVLASLIIAADRIVVTNG